MNVQARTSTDNNLLLSVLASLGLALVSGGGHNQFAHLLHHQTSLQLDA